MGPGCGMAAVRLLHVDRRTREKGGCNEGSCRATKRAGHASRGRPGCRPHWRGGHRLCRDMQGTWETSRQASRLKFSTVHVPSRPGWWSRAWQTGGRPATCVDRETPRSPRLICWMDVGDRGPADVNLAVLLSHNNVPETALAGSRVSRACKDLGERRTGKRTALWVAAVSANGPGRALLTPSCRATLGPWLVVDIEMVSAQSAECMALTAHHLLLTVNSAKVPTTSPASVARQGRLLGRGNGGCWGLVRSW